ncbi:MAG: hypothetical protein AAF127_09830 [Pseudomonadota bacterium]
MSRNLLQVRKDRAIPRPPWPLLLLGALVASGIIFAPSLRSAAQKGYDASAYEQLISDMSDAQLLITQDTGVEREPGQSLQRVAFAMDQFAGSESAAVGGCADSVEACAELLDDLRRNTFLANDMLDADSGAWTRDGNLITGLREGAHKTPPLVAKRSGWGGRIDYRGGLRFPALQLVDTQSREVMLVFGEAGACSYSGEALDADQCKASGGASSAGTPEAARAQITASGASASGGGVRASRVGDHLLVSVPAQLRGLTVTVDGKVVSGGGDGSNGASNGAALRKLSIGQYLGLSDGRGEGRSYQLLVRPGAISQTGGARGKRIRARGFEQPSQWLENTNIAGNQESSIRFGLHNSVQNALTEAAMVEMTNNPRDKTSFRVAALLMDGMTGEVVAMPTFPTQRKHLYPGDEESALRLRWLTTNSNLVRLPVGSTAKVPFAAAIAMTHPDLIEGTRPCPADIARVGDIRLVKGRNTPIELARNCTPGAPIDVETHITRSTNGYALYLLNAAETRQQDGTGWRESLHQLTCLIPADLGGAGVDQGWRSRDVSCAKPLWLAPDGEVRGSRQPAPPLTYLMLNQVENEYTDRYLSILGNGRSVWTTVGLAQAYARVITGRMVAARLSAVEDRKRADLIADTPMFTSLPGDDPARVAAWRRVLAGMHGATGWSHRPSESSAVPVSPGTARALRGPVEKALGKGVYAMAKTGTPEVVRARIDGRIEPGQNGHAIVFAVARTKTGAPPQRPSDICSLRIAAVNFQDSDQSGAARRFVQRMLETNRAFQNWMRAPCS